MRKIQRRFFKINTYEEIKKEGKAPINIIHGTDWWTDCDDIAALRLLLRAYKEGIIKLLGIGVNSVMEYSAPSISAFCNADGLDIPIGIDKNACRPPINCRYQKVLAEYPHRVSSNDDCPDAAVLYRKILANLDGKADITEVGFPQIIMQLLKSKPDDISPLSGVELVKEKVNKIWMMAGRWDIPNGREYNLSAYPVSAEAGDYICKNCPVPITFLGFEIGNSIIVGDKLDQSDILFKGFEAHGSENGRFSWDPLTVLMAIINDEEKAGYKIVKGVASVDPKSGVNNFVPDCEGSHAYVVKKKSDDWYADKINELL